MLNFKLSVSKVFIGFVLTGSNEINGETCLTHRGYDEMGKVLDFARSESFLSDFTSLIIHTMQAAYEDNKPSEVSLVVVDEEDIEHHFSFNL